MTSCRGAFAKSSRPEFGWTRPQQRPDDLSSSHVIDNLAPRHISASLDLAMDLSTRFAASSEPDMATTALPS